eukprot:m.242250 g.242250  ORF g.242250 m.242250 type:complete len:139 (-) comp54438_c0_seq2:347-763(-)
MRLMVTGSSRWPADCRSSRSSMASQSCGKTRMPRETQIFGMHCVSVSHFLWIFTQFREIDASNKHTALAGCGILRAAGFLAGLVRVANLVLLLESCDDAVLSLKLLVQLLDRAAKHFAVACQRGNDLPDSALNKNTAN